MGSKVYSEKHSVLWRGTFRDKVYSIEFHLKLFLSSRYESDMMRGPGFIEIGTLSCCLREVHNKASETSVETKNYHRVTLCLNAGKHTSLKPPKDCSWRGLQPLCLVGIGQVKKRRKGWPSYQKA